MVHLVEIYISHFTPTYKKPQKKSKIKNKIAWLGQGLLKSDCSHSRIFFKLCTCTQIPYIRFAITLEPPRPTVLQLARTAGHSGQNIQPPLITYESWYGCQKIRTAKFSQDCQVFLFFVRSIHTNKTLVAIISTFWAIFTIYNQVTYDISSLSFLSQQSYHLVAFNGQSPPIVANFIWFFFWIQNYNATFLSARAVTLFCLSCQSNLLAIL